VNLHSFVNDNCIMIHNFFYIPIAPPHFPPKQHTIASKFCIRKSNPAKIELQFAFRIGKIVTLDKFTNTPLYPFFIPGAHQRRPKSNSIPCSFFHSLVFFIKSRNCLLPLMILRVTALVAIYEFHHHHLLYVLIPHPMSSQNKTTI
jgi:hypothetical protein